MSENLVTVRGRQVQKHDLEVNWIKAGKAENPFIPLKGEIIIYDPEVDLEGNILELPETREIPYTVSRQKIGDGITNIIDLPFSNGILTSGYGINSIIQTGLGTKALGAETIALGRETLAGCKGYHISSFDSGEMDENGIYPSGTYTLVLNEGEVIPQELIGAVYSMYLKQTKDGIGNITAINNNIITVSPFFYPAKWDEGQWEELDEDGNKTGNTLTGDAWEAAKEEAFQSSYIIFEEFPDVGNIIVGTGAFAQGYQTSAMQIGAHAEGANSIAQGKFSHAEGDTTLAYYSSHSEGKYSKALGYHSHAEGYMTEATGMDSHAEGRTTKAIGQDSHAEGISTISEGIYSHAEGRSTVAIGQAAHSEGQSTEASGSYSHTEGFSTNASGQAAHSEGYRTISSNVGSHSEGVDTQATARAAHAEGLNSKATAQSSHAEGYNSTASGENAHAEGYITAASGLDAHTEGRSTVASGKHSHAQGFQSKAYGDYSHAGGHTSQTGKLSSDGNLGTTASTSGAYAFAHGFQAKAEARGSIALGRDVVANEEFQAVVGAFNDTSKTEVRFAVGTGTNSSNLKNGLTVYKDGRVEAGADPENNLDLVTKQYVDNKIEEEDFTAIIDVTADMTIEDIQYLIDGVNGTLVLNFIDYLEVWGETLNFSHVITDLYITGICPSITLQGWSSEAHQNIFCQNGDVENTTISRFGKVYNASPAGDIQNCGILYDSFAQYEISDCDQLVRSGASSGAGGQGYTRITNCNSLIDCSTFLVPSLNEQVTISNCGRVDNFSITCDESTDWWEEPYIHFDNCNFVSNVYLTSNSDTNLDVQYNNCNKIHNCYGYDEDIITSDDLSELNTSLTNKINEAKDACSPKNQSTSIILNASEGQQLPTGWYNIATLPKSSSSLLLHVRYGATGGRWSSFLLSIEMTYNAGACGSIPSIKVLNCSHRTGNSSNMNSTNYACTKARVRYDNNTSKIQNNAYLDLYLPYTNSLKSDGSINGNVSLFAKVLSNTDEIDHAAGKCTLATSFNAAEVATNEWSKETLIDTPKDQLIVSELPADPDTNTIYFIV